MGFSTLLVFTGSKLHDMYCRSIQRNVVHDVQSVSTDDDKECVDGREVDTSSFIKRFQFSKEANTDESKHDDQPVVASDVGDCVCVFYQCDHMFGTFHTSSPDPGSSSWTTDLVEYIGELPPGGESLIEFLETAGDDAKIAVAAGYMAPDNFVRTIKAVVEKHVEKDVTMLRIPYDVGVSYMAFVDGKIIFCSKM